MKKYFSSILLLIFIWACKSSVNELSPNAQPTAKQLVKDLSKRIKLRKNYLEFQTENDLKEFLKKQKSKTRQELDTWEKSVGFVSLRNIYEQALEAEETYVASLMNQLTASSTQNQGNSAFVNKYRKCFVIEKGMGIRTNIFNPEMAKVVNEDGIVKISGHLFQYTNDYLKMLEKGDDRKLESFLKATKSDKANGIIVNPVTLVKDSKDKALNYYDSCGEFLALSFPWKNGYWVGVVEVKRVLIPTY